MKAQSSLEYVLTYGWLAIIPVIFIAGFLFALVLATILIYVSLLLTNAIGLEYTLIALAVVAAVFLLLGRFIGGLGAKRGMSTIGGVFVVVFEFVLLFTLVYPYLGLLYYAILTVAIGVVITLIQLFLLKEHRSRASRAIGHAPTAGFGLLLLYEIVVLIGLWYYIALAVIVGVVVAAVFMRMNKRKKIIGPSPPMSPDQPVKT